RGVPFGRAAAGGQRPQERGHLLGAGGELSLVGAVGGVPGVLSIALAAAEAGLEVVVPAASYGEAQLVPGLRAVAVGSLREAVDRLRGAAGPAPVRGAELAAPAEPGDEEDLADVRGQAMAKRALELTAAGGHNLLMLGPPGVGKTMLARRLVGILPPLDPMEY